MSVQPSRLFGDIPEALAPLSAGTETTICVVSDCDPTTNITINVPHPTWTDGYGKAIVLLDLVEIGGTNGLNS